MRAELTANVTHYMYILYIPIRVYPSIKRLFHEIAWTFVDLKVHKIEIFFGFDFEISIISLLVMSKY